MCQKNALKKNILIYWFIYFVERHVMFLSKILINLCMIIHYIVEKNVFVVIT